MAGTFSSRRVYSSSSRYVSSQYRATTFVTMTFQGLSVRLTAARLVLRIPSLTKPSLERVLDMPEGLTHLVLSHDDFL